MSKRLRPTSKKSHRGKRGNECLRLSAKRPRKGKTKDTSTRLTTESMNDSTATNNEPMCSTGGKQRSFGGVVVGLRRVVDEEQCPCGKTVSVCNAEWDGFLNITQHTTEDYKENLRKVHGAEAEGRDPYHWRARIGLIQ